MSHTGNGKQSSPMPTMQIDTVQFLRLLPTRRDLPPEYRTGVALFLAATEARDRKYFLTLTEADARRLADDLNAHFSGQIDVANPEDNYGAAED